MSTPNEEKQLVFDPKKKKEEKQLVFEDENQTRKLWGQA